MKTENLKNKLTKINIDYSIVENDILFSINGLNFIVGFDNQKISDYCIENCYDNTNQEMQRRFFSNFNQLLKYANL